MKGWKRLSIVCGLLLVLSLVFNGVTVAAAPADNPGENPSGFAKVVFITYAKDLAPANPLRPSSAVAGVIESEEIAYNYSGYHWSDAKIPVHYRINHKLGHSKVPSTFLEGIQAAFQTWEDDSASYMDFTYDGTTTAGISSLRGRRDGKNVVGWADLTRNRMFGPGVIAVTWYWYNPITLELVEVDVAMNSNDCKWWQNLPGETWLAGNDTTLFDVDVQNIMTHEAGHWLVLNDIYDASYINETMYGYADEWELNKRSLESGDIDGIGHIYTGSTKP